MTAVSPLSGKTDLVTYTILADGAKLPDVYEVSQIKVHKQVNRIASAKIMLYDGDPSTGDFVISSSSTLLPGVKITINAGYHGQEATIFKGVVVKHGIKIGASSKSYLVVTCFDPALKLTLGRKSGYVGKSDQEIFSNLISAAGLQASVSSTTATTDEIVRYYATDWDFLVARAEINEQIVLVDDGTVTVQAPQVDGDPFLYIEYGDALLQMNAEIDASQQLPSVTCSAWDFASQAVVAGNSSEPSVNSQGNLDGPTLSKVLNIDTWQMQVSAPLADTELTNWANAQLLKSRMARVRGKVSFRGNATPKPGGLIELLGVGDRFNGNAFMSSVAHTIEDGAWITEVGMGLSMQWFVEDTDNVEAPLASGLLPGVNGLLIGTVKQIDQDAQNRVLVEAPMIQPTGDGIWARLASNYATSKAGIFFYPEIGDEVVLGFLNDDPSFPVILGSLSSSIQHTPPFTPDAPNTNKAIVTKAQLKITMDDVKKVIVVQTPGGQVITLSDDANSIVITDSNKNSLQLSSSGITLDSCADITLTAKGGVTIKANGGSMTLKAAEQLSASALSVGISASEALTLQGDASAKLSASGETVIQGAMVMIN